MKSSLHVLVLACVGLATALPEPGFNIQDEDFEQVDIITRDVCIVGGGSAGTYTATRLRQLGQSVVVVEKEALMGGMTNTYTVPGSGVKVDYGVVVFHNISIVQNYFTHYNVPLTNETLGEGNYNIDFVTGKVIDGTANETESVLALEAYMEQLNKYSYLIAGYNLPDPVPEDLLIPLKEFVMKYNLGPMVPFTQLGGGYADILEQPTLYTIKLLGPDLVRSVLEGFVTSAAHDNGALYEAATAQYANSRIQNSSK